MSFAAAVSLLACAAAGHARVAAPTALRLIGVGEIARDGGPGEAPVGGVSGIDYDPRARRWYLISDDRSEHAAARFWRADIDYGLGKAPVASRLELFPLHSENGRTFAEPGHGAEASDAESIRVDPLTGELVWSSEGDARDGFGPAVRRMTAKGAPALQLRLPPMFRFDPTAGSGPRSNLSIEGLTFASRGRILWFSMEAPLIEDGPVASRDAGAIVRFTALDHRSGAFRNQFAYRLEPIGPTAPDRLADNGVSEILSVDAEHFLVIERSGAQQDDKEFRFRPRLYCASTLGATPVSHLASLRDGPVRPMAKRLVFDFTSIAVPPIDNVEGVTWGPLLANGHLSLLFVTDNDFSTKRPPTQLIAFDTGASSDRRFVQAFCPR